MNKNTAPQSTAATIAPSVSPTLSGESGAAATATAPMPKKSGWLPLGGFLLAICAWLCLAYSTGYLAMGVAAASIVVAAFGTRRHTGAWRNVAITAIIASGVLIVVVLAFLIVLKLVLA